MSYGRNFGRSLVSNPINTALIARIISVTAMNPAAPIPDSPAWVVGAGSTVGAGAGRTGVTEKRLSELTRTKASGVVVGVTVDVWVGVGVVLLAGRARRD